MLSWCCGSSGLSGAQDRGTLVECKTTKTSQTSQTSILAHIHARYLAQAILGNSEWAREGCLVGKGANARAPLLSANDAALALGSSY